MKLSYRSVPSVARQRRTGFHREIVLAVLCLLCLVSIARWGRDASEGYPRFLSLLVEPFRIVLSGVNSVEIGTHDFIGNFLELRTQTESLKEELEHHKQELIAAHQREEQLRMLLPLAQVFEPTQFETVRATVVGQGGTDYRTLIVDQGSSNGVGTNMPVFIGSGLVGRLDRVLPNASRVILLQDRNSAVGAEVRSETGEVLVEGLVYGTGSSLDDTLRLEVAGVTTPLEGASVYTSSLSVYYPSGLQIGRVERTVPGIAQVFERYVVRPAVDVRSVRQVFILTSLNRSDSLTLTTEEDGSYGPR